MALMENNPATESASDFRTRWGLNDGWRFVRGRTWRGWVKRKTPRLKDPEVWLPHCWNTQDTFQKKVSAYRGRGGYWKSFLPPPELCAGAALWLLEAEGFYGVGDVWFDGQRIAKVDGQYLGFSLDLTPLLRPGQEHTLGVRLDNAYHANVLPGIRKPDFILYGGLSGRLWLNRIPLLHLVPENTQITCPDVFDKPQVRLVCPVTNGSSASRQFMLQCSIRDPQDRVIGTAKSSTLNVEPAHTSVVPFRILVPSPQVWSLEDPIMYTVTWEVVADDQVVDRISKRFGLRTAAFKPEGFFLNGQRVALRGCSRHESMPGFGRALPEALHRRDAELIKESGFNLVRLSHYPQSPSFLDACDELGILVYPEIATWRSVRPRKWVRSACRQLKDMILRDMNHPSVLVWGLGDTSRSKEAYTALHALAKELDPLRPTIYAEDMISKGYEAETLKLPDIVGISHDVKGVNYAIQASRAGCILVTEMGGYPHAERGLWDEELMQIAWFEEYLHQIQDNPAVAGYILWLLADYATPREKRRGQHSGVADSWRLPKMASAWHAAIGLEKPFLKVFGDWSLEPERASRGIVVFTNCDTVDFSLNGSRCLSLEHPIEPFQSVRFEPCDLVARGRRQGAEVTDRLVPFGPAQKVEVRPEAALAQALGHETVAVDILVADGEGRRVANWNGTVQVEVCGPALSRVYTRKGEIPVGAGAARTFITGNGKEGEVVVRVRGVGGLAGEARVVFEKGSLRHKEL